MTRSSKIKAYPKAPDGGYGWIIVFSSFMIHFLADGITYTFGIFYVELLKHFKAGKGITAWVPSIMTGITYGIGPIASGLTNKYGCRTITIVGALFASFGLMISVVAPNVTFLFFSIGICAGAGFGLIYLPAIVSVTCYFEKRRAFATGIAVCGSGIGSAAFAPLTEWLIDLYGWRGGLLIISSLLLNCCVFGALLRPLKDTGQKITEKDENNRNSNMSIYKNNNNNNNNNKIDVNSKMIEGSLSDKMASRNVIMSKKIAPQSNNINMESTNGDSKSCCYLNRNNNQSTVGSLSNLVTGNNVNSSNENVKGLPMLTISEPLSPSRHSICALYPPISGQLKPSMEMMETKCDTLIVNNAKNTNDNNLLLKGATHETIINTHGYVIQQQKGPSIIINNNANQVNSIQPDAITGNTETINVTNRRKHSATSSCGILNRRDIFYSASLMHLNLPINHRSNQKLSYSASTSAVNDVSNSSIVSEVSPDVVRPEKTSETKSNGFYVQNGEQIGSSNRYIIPCSSSLSDCSSATSSSSNSQSFSLSLDSQFKWYCMSDCMAFLCSHEVRDTFDEMMNFRLLLNPIFLAFSISNLLTSLGYYVPHIYIKDRVVGLKLASDSEASNLLAIIGIASTFGRLIFGFISDLQVINRLLLFNCCVSICGLSTILSSFFQTYTYMALYCIIFGVTCGAYVSLTSVILVDLLGIEKLTNAFGLVLLFQGVACLIGPPIVGWMFDLTGSYDPGFTWAGSMILIGGLILFFIPYLAHDRFRLTLSNGRRKVSQVIVKDVNLLVG